MFKYYLFLISLINFLGMQAAAQGAPHKLRLLSPQEIAELKNDPEYYNIDLDDALEKCLKDDPAAFFNGSTTTNLQQANNFIQIGADHVSASGKYYSRPLALDYSKLLRMHNLWADDKSENERGQSKYIELIRNANPKTKHIWRKTVRRVKNLEELRDLNKISGEFYLKSHFPSE